MDGAVEKLPPNLKFYHAPHPLSQNLLDRYILDYLKRRGFDTAAAIFAVEARVGDGPPGFGCVRFLDILFFFTSSQEDDSLSRLIPRGVPLTHFLDEFPQESESSSKPESSLPEKQGTSNVPVKVFRRDSRQHKTMGQLRLRPKSNKGGDVANKDDTSIEKDELISEYHPSQDKNVFKGRIKTFKEVETFFTSNEEVLCCHFSSDGKLLATAGNDKMVSVWNVESLCHLGNTPQLSNMITDVRFMPHSTVFATSSFDTTVRLWDAADVSKLLVELHGHVDQVISLDFNRHEPEIICSCDCNGEIRLWDINELACISIYKVDGGVRQVRFQFRDLLAVALGNMILLVDVEINKKECLKGHTREIRSICWDQSGSYLASVSEDSARVWSTNSCWKCDYELYSTDSMFQSCTFHPVHSLLLVIGCYQIIELWDCVKGSKTRSIKIHGGIISALTDSQEDGLIASTSNDGHIRLWR
ncbi:hypothetical protein L6452_44593 [Arctium lappa]|uniref:Uncharacterized protein n=1 Tax=Arctium lappa TaxID=4217 RepID=A0ACB8XGM0_ARCLA|nr:hypothetical protein L6452_44593 [Arctium lappa]